MKLVESSVYTGPSLFGARPRVRFRVAFDEPKSPPDAKLRAAALAELDRQLPALCPIIDGLGAEMPVGAMLAAVLMHGAVALQREIGAEVETGEVRPAIDGSYDVTWGYEEAETGAAAGRLALNLVRELARQLDPRPSAVRIGVDFARARAGFRQAAERHAIALQHRHVAQAASARDIPWQHLGEGLVLFGQGRFQKLRLGHFNPRTGHVGWLLSSDKPRTNRLLAGLGLPVPRQHVVSGWQGAVQAAEEIGFPVVVKPVNSDYGRGVSTGLADAAAVREAFERARRYARAVIVESMLEGFDHRLLVIDGELVAAVRREPAHVTGDGVTSVEALVAEVNREPRRGPKGKSWYVRLELDEEALRLLAAAGHTAKSVPAAGERLNLRVAASVSDGGTATDVLDRVHPDNRRMAIWAAGALGIDAAGIDFMTPDIARSHREVGGGICEVNTSPGLTAHASPEGAPEGVAERIMASIFPPGSVGRIPIAVITGEGERDATARLLAHILARAGHTVGLASGGHVRIGGAEIAEASGGEAARMILRNPTVDAAVFALAPEALVEEGLGFDACDAAAVLQAPPAGAADAARDPLAAVGAAAQVARKACVVDAADAAAQGLGAGERLCLVAADAGDEAFKAHVERGGAGIALAGASTLRLHEAGAATEIEVGPGLADRASCVLFAAALARALGQPAEAIAEALRNFDAGAP